MKKWLIITMSILILLFFILQLFTDHVHNVKSERQLYVERLRFNFSGEIDSVTFLRKGLGLILFHVTRGDIDQSVYFYENKLNDQLEENGQLEHNRQLRFLVFKLNGKIEIEFPMNTPSQCLSGDSVYIGTSENQIIVYRNRKEISRGEVTQSLRGMPF